MAPCAGMTGHAASPAPGSPASTWQPPSGSAPPVPASGAAPPVPVACVEPPMPLVCEAPPVPLVCEAPPVPSPSVEVECEEEPHAVSSAAMERTGSKFEVRFIELDLRFIGLRPRPWHPPCHAPALRFPAVLEHTRAPAVRLGRHSVARVTRCLVHSRAADRRVTALA